MYLSPPRRRIATSQAVTNTPRRRGPRAFGPPLWRRIHAQAAGAVSSHQRGEFRHLMEGFRRGMGLPCEKCSSGLNDIMWRIPIGEYLSSAARVFEWTWRVHNAVNMKLGKPPFPLAAAVELYPPPPPLLLGDDDDAFGGEAPRPATAARARLARFAEPPPPTAAALGLGTTSRVRPMHSMPDYRHPAPPQPPQLAQTHFWRDGATTTAAAQHSMPRPGSAGPGSRRVRFASAAAATTTMMPLAPQASNLTLSSMRPPPTLVHATTSTLQPPAAPLRAPFARPYANAVAHAAPLPVPLSARRWGESITSVAALPPMPPPRRFWDPLPPDVAPIMPRPMVARSFVASAPPPASWYGRVTVPTFHDHRRVQSLNQYVF
jgi:hypothetical protein